jgi:energy-coupling factor transport system ATP-binding protein
MIELKSVSYTYPQSEKPALRDITLRIPAGCCVMITGPSGSGKTTFCLASAGILAHEYSGKKEGSVSIQGRDVGTFRNLSDLASHIGIVFDDPEAQLIFTSVEEEIISALERRGLSAQEVEKRLSDVMEVTHLTPLKDRGPHTLSGGQKQRLVLATTLALSTDILILDEPTAELDERGTTAIFELLKKLKSEGKTIILVEHKFPRMREIVDILIVIEDGKVTAMGPPDSVIGDPRIRRIVFPDFSGLKERFPGIHGASREPVISVRNLRHSYGNIHAITGIDLSVMRGEFIAIVGENGSGKTTLIKHFNGLLHPTEGVVTVRGKNTTSATITDLARYVGMVFQNPDHMFFADTVHDEVAFGVDNLRLADREGIIDRVLEKAGLMHTKNLYPRWLSRGERQRLAIACVLAMQPEVIVLDEPTTGLDGNEAREVMDVLKELQQNGHTIIIVTHSREIAQEVADRIITMDHGKIITDITTVT